MKTKNSFTKKFLTLLITTILILQINSNQSLKFLEEEERSKKQFTNKEIMLNPTNLKDLKNFNQKNYTKLVLDSFALLQGEKKFNDKIWNELYSSISKDPDTPNVLEAMELGWKGIMKYGQENSTSDPWGIHFHWRENNLTKLPEGKLSNISNVKITEPCDTVSNLAYFWTYLNIANQHRNNWILSPQSIKGLKKGFIFEAVGSAFFHMSGTSVGGSMDVNIMNNFGWVIHQGSLGKFTNNQVLLNLREEKTELNSTEVYEQIEQMFLKESVYNWKPFIEKMYIPQVYTSVGAVITTAFTILTNADDTKWLIDFIGKYLIKPEDIKFLKELYLPQLTEELKEKNIKIGFFPRIKFARRFLGTCIKLLYAVFYQEEFLIQDFIASPISTKIGSLMMPIFNRMMNGLTGYDRYSYSYDKLEQESINSYPGRDQCGGKAFGHPLWHEQTGNALYDLILLSEDINRVLNKVELSN